MTRRALRAVPRQRPFIAFSKPDVGKAEVDAVTDAIWSGWLTTGPRVREFEQRFAAWVGAPHAVATSSCTAGLHLSLLAAGVGPGDEVVTSPLTFCATANTIIHAGATPIFADVERETMTLDARLVEGVITPRTRALLPVHFAGRPVDVGAFMDLGRARGLRVIEDAAHAVGAAWKGRRIGAVADYTCFSFYATKNLTTGEGGMVTTASADRAEWVRVASLHGMSRDAWKRYHADGTPQYDVVMAGFKYNMTDLQAAMGLEQLARLTRMHQRRDAIWRAYDEALAALPVERPAPAAPDTVHARHLYTVLVDEERSGWTRDGLQQALHDRGIGTSIHFRALHLHPFYAERFGLRRGMFPAAEYISDHTLSLPLSAALSDEEVERTIETVAALIEAPPRRAQRSVSAAAAR